MARATMSEDQLNEFISRGGKVQDSTSATAGATHANDAAGQGTQREQAGGTALAHQVGNPQGLVHIAGPLRVRIIRFSKGRIKDHDNLLGGSKSLRDAITDLLGRTDDSEEAGFIWEYEQEKGETQTVIEIWRD